jgi:hypothetical protein
MQLKWNIHVIQIRRAMCLYHIFIDWVISNYSGNTVLNLEYIICHMSVYFYVNDKCGCELSDLSK